MDQHNRQSDGSTPKVDDLLAKIKASDASMKQLKTRNTELLREIGELKHAKKELEGVQKRNSKLENENRTLQAKLSANATVKITKNSYPGWEMERFGTELESHRNDNADLNDENRMLQANGSAKPTTTITEDPFPTRDPLSGRESAQGMTELETLKKLNTDLENEIRSLRADLQRANDEIGRLGAAIMIAITKINISLTNWDVCLYHNDVATRHDFVGASQDLVKIPSGDKLRKFFRKQDVYRIKRFEEYQKEKGVDFGTVGNY
ncbi:hypothetical protein BDV96DRAFT_606567 [Lophiotrema nucula]|uniref:Uncharacterized protein n=1 Tax=Lophiotrema nucula TaxID=690887 RepID=A0A6A5YJW8_9PLEO|nr:hypothetical protein BDV96DRAFT_606567 [Lophiotrema nucula]